MPLNVSELYIMSWMPTTETIADSLINVINSLPKAGNTFLNACGNITYLMEIPFDIPSDFAASICPLSIELIPALNISAI